MKNAFILFTGITLFFAACKSNETGNSKDVAPDQVYRKYEVNIDQETASASASAVFRFAGDKGTTLRLSSPAKITANGSDLTEGKLLFGGAYYRNEVSCPDNQVILKYIDTKESVLEESFNAGSAAFPGHPDTFYLGRTLSIPFSVSGGDKADSYEILIRDKENRALSFYAGAGNVFEIPGTATDTLAQGEVKIQVISHKRKELDNHSTLGGTADFSCSYKPLKVVAVKKKENS